jgi:energy-converting hydrogenase Eha subunit C
VNATSAAPVRKVAAATLAGALVTLVVWAAATFLHLNISAEVAAAIVTVVIFVVGYLVPARVGEYVV